MQGFRQQAPKVAVSLAATNAMISIAQAASSSAHTYPAPYLPLLDSIPAYHAALLLRIARLNAAWVRYQARTPQ